MDNNASQSRQTAKASSQTTSATELHARMHNQQHTLNIQQHSIYKIRVD